MKLLSDQVPAKLRSSEPYGSHFRPPLLRKEIEKLKGVPHLLRASPIYLRASPIYASV
jgi:hypothetical protein